MPKNDKDLLLNKSQMLAISDAITGELTGVSVNVYVKRDKPKFNEQFTYLFQAVNSLVVKSIKPVTCKVLLYLMSKSLYGNVIDLSALEIADDLGYTARNVQIAFKELEKNKIIIRSPHPSDKRKHLLYLNPYQSWKGAFKDRSKTITKIENLNQTKLEFETEKQKELSSLYPNEGFNNE